MIEENAVSDLILKQSRIDSVAKGGQSYKADRNDSASHGTDESEEGSVAENKDELTESCAA